MDYQKIKDESMSISDWIISIRRELHEHPELMYEEFKTSELIRRELDKLKIPYKYPIAETGVLASIGNGNGPCVALRERIWMLCQSMKKLMCHSKVK